MDFQAIKTRFNLNAILQNYRLIITNFYFSPKKAPSRANYS
jgi:hypothetical protein